MLEQRGMQLVAGVVLEVARWWYFWWWFSRKKGQQGVAMDGSSSQQK